MDYSMEEGSVYRFTSGSGRKIGMIVTAAVSFAIFITLASLAVVYFIMRRTGNTTSLYIIPVILVVMVPSDIALLLFLRKRFSSARVTIDCMRGSLYFKSFSSLLSRTVKIDTAYITAITLGRRTADGYGVSPQGGQYCITIETPSGEMEIMHSSDLDSIRSSANEIASILSLQLRDSV